MNRRLAYTTTFLICAALLGAGYYFQYVKGLHPCLLCIMQRLAYYLLALVCLIAVMQRPATKRGHCVYGILALLASLLGAGLAIRQVWLQHLPDGQVPGCGPGLNFMLQNYPLHDAIKALFYGSGDCALVTWTFMSFSMAEWSALFFVAFSVAWLVFLLKLRKK